MATTREWNVTVPNVREGNWNYAALPLRGTNASTRTTRTGEGVPFYKKKIKAGQNASSPYSVDTFRVLKAVEHNVIHVRKLRGGDPTTVIHSETQTSKGYFVNMDNSILSGLIPHLGTISSATDNKAIARLHKDIREGSYSVNGLLVLGELRETIGLLRNPFRSARENFIKYTDALKTKASVVRGEIRLRKSDTPANLSYRRANALKNAMAGTWLEFQFGIKPALSDSEDIVKGLNRAVDTFIAKNKRYTGSAKEPVAFSQDNSFSIPGVPYTLGIWSGEQGRITNSSVRYVAIYKPSVFGSTDFSSRLALELGFNIENFVPTVWELVPWSFLIDYFVNVGKILECSTTGQFDLVTCVKSDRQITQLNRFDTLEAYSEPYGPVTWFTASLTGRNTDKRVLLRTTISRTVHQFLPVPTLQFSVPGYGSVKWANMAALAANMRDISRFKRG